MHSHLLDALSAVMIYRSCCRVISNVKAVSLKLTKINQLNYYFGYWCSYYGM